MAIKIDSEMIPGFDSIEAAIVDDDVKTVKRLLKDQPGLASFLIPTPKLHSSGIFHWIYTGDTWLHLAAAGYRVEIVKLLLSAGADPNAARNRRKSRPMHYASDGFISGPAYDEEDQVLTLTTLIQNGACIHAQDANGASPLHRAVRTRCAAAVKFLLDAGSDPAMRNKSGSNPFHLAVQNTGRGGSGEQKAIDAQREIIEEFIARGVRLTLKDGKGKSVIESIQSNWIRELLA